jgi:hypothetical protein
MNQENCPGMATAVTASTGVRAKRVCSLSSESLALDFFRESRILDALVPALYRSRQGRSLFFRRPS